MSPQKYHFDRLSLSRGTILSPAASQRLALPGSSSACATGNTWRQGVPREASMRSDLSRRIALAGIGTASMQVFHRYVFTLKSCCKIVALKFLFLCCFKKLVALPTYTYFWLFTGTGSKNEFPVTTCRISCCPVTSGARYSEQQIVNPAHLPALCF